MQNDLITRYQAALAQDFPATALKTLIVLWAIGLIIVALVINNRWVLAGILLYEVLP